MQNHLRFQCLFRVHPFEGFLYYPITSGSLIINELFSVIFVRPTYFDRYNKSQNRGNDKNKRHNQQHKNLLQNDLSSYLILKSFHITHNYHQISYRLLDEQQSIQVQYTDSALVFLLDPSLVFELGKFSADGFRSRSEKRSKIFSGHRQTVLR